MASLSRESQEIEQILNFAQEMMNSPERRGDRKAVQRIISPTKTGTRLMRQISGLGMEDPVFRTNECGPEHPSNIFDDMSVGDIPSDMLDMVSVASDPTAAQGAGLDFAFFQLILESTENYFEAGNRKKRPSLLDATPTSKVEFQKSSLLHSTESPTRRMDETSNSASPPIGSSTNETSHLFSKLKSKSETDRPVTTASEKCLRKTGPRCILNSATRGPQIQKEIHRSLPSIDLEAAYRESEVRISSSVTKEAIYNKETGSSNYPSHTMNAMLVEAAHAMEEQGSHIVGRKLIEAAKCQHAISSSLRGPIQLDGGIPAVGNAVSDANVVDKKAADYPIRRRVMPTLSGLFPS